MCKRVHSDGNIAVNRTKVIVKNENNAGSVAGAPAIDGNCSESGNLPVADKNVSETGNTSLRDFVEKKSETDILSMDSDSNGDNKPLSDLVMKKGETS